MRQKVFIADCAKICLCWIFSFYSIFILPQQCLRNFKLSASQFGLQVLHFCRPFSKCVSHQQAIVSTQFSMCYTFLSFIYPFSRLWVICMSDRNTIQKCILCFFNIKKNHCHNQIFMSHYVFVKQYLSKLVMINDSGNFRYPIKT